MSKKVTLGGERLGSGEKMTEELSGYGYSVHDLGYVWKSSMTVGTLVPFMTELMLNGDYAEIDLNTIMRTHPTVGAMFGTFKLQLDVFKIPIRYYNKMLHNNKKGIGMEMNKVLFPLMEIIGNEFNPALENANNQQINTSSLLHYLGISGLGKDGNTTGIVKRRFNAIPLLGYWDIYSNYYANLQEKIGVVIGTNAGTVLSNITLVEYLDTDGGVEDITQDATTQGSHYQWVLFDQQYDNGEIIIEGENLGINSLIIQYGYRPAGTTQPITIQARLDGDNDLRQYISIEYKNNGKKMVIAKRNNLTSHDVFIIRGATPALTDEQEIIIGMTGIKLQTFDLENIDKMREDILSAPTTTPFIIDRNTYNPYEATTGVISTDTEDMSKSKAVMAGLGIKTYQSDRFNNWLNTDYIDGVNGVNELSKIDVSDGTLTMDQLNLQQKIYNVLNRIALSGGSYRDWQEAVYDRRGTGELEIPEWLGGCSSEILFDEVISTAEAGEEKLGTLGGRGRQSEERKNTIKITALEPLFIMGIVSITPRLDYSQGNRWFMRLKNMNELHKPELDGIGFQELLTEEFAAFDTITSNFIEEYKSIGKQLAWTEYTTNVNQSHGAFANGETEEFMALNRGYENDENGNLMDGTTYIDPTKYSYAFATTSLTDQHFWLQIGVNIKMNRVMASKQIPQL
jgi:hypothetical protein